MRNELRRLTKGTGELRQTAGVWLVVDRRVWIGMWIVMARAETGPVGATGPEQKQASAHARNSPTQWGMLGRPGEVSAHTPTAAPERIIPRST